MTVRKGASWGWVGPLPADGVVARSDAEARAVVEEFRRAGRTPPPIGLLGGDLCRTVGGSGDLARLRSSEAMTLPVDLGRVVADGREHWFIAHLVARRSWWRGELVAVMNAQFMGRWDAAPRGHPDDARLEVIDVSMRARERLQAWRRLPTGTHVPHPRVTIRRVPTWSRTFVRPLPLWLDGERVAAGVRHIDVWCEPDAALVVV